MRKFLLTAMILIAALCLCACSGKNTSSTPDLVTQYYNYAKDCIDSGDKEKASAALKEGIEKTDSQKLKDLLDSLNKSNVSENESSADSTSSKSPSSTSVPPTNSSSATNSTDSVKNEVDICGLYKDKESYVDYTIYKKDGGYKVLIKVSNMGGYFQLIDNGDGSYNVANSGTSIYKAYGQYEATDISYLLYSKSVNLKFSPETEELTVKTVSDGSSFYGEGKLMTSVIKRDGNFNADNFTETFD